MTDSTAVEKAASQVPALAPTPAVEIGSDDIALPRLYIGQFMSDHVQEGRVKAGSLFTAQGSDDPDPQVLSDGDEQVVFHVLAMRKGKSLSIDGELELFAFNDPNAPPEAWVTYNYVIALPAVDKELPYKLLLTRTATRAAKNINLVLAKNAARGPVYTNAFGLTTADRENKKGKFYVPRITVVEADEADVKIAESLASLVPSGDVVEQSTGDEPAI